MNHQKIMLLTSLIAIVASVSACGGSAYSAPDYHSESSTTTTAATSTTTTATTTTTTASTSSSAYLPAKGETAAYTDTRLKITFDAAPTLGTSGLINIYKQSDDSLVDSIDLSTRHPVAALSSTLASVDSIGKNVTPTAGRVRWVYYTPVKITGNSATIYPHNGVLLNNTAYYVTIDNAAFAGKINSANFAGLTKSSGWNFITKSAPTAASVTVDDDGTADFRTVQGALNYMMNIGSSTGCTPACSYAAVDKTITIKNGTYDEMMFVRNVNQLTISGESRNGVVIQYDNFDSLNSGSGGSAVTVSAAPALGGGRAVLLAEGGDLITLSNFTLKNTHVKAAAYNNQAETIYFNSSTTTGSRLMGKQMNFLGTQDTIQTKGWAWFYQSLITGDVDFMWGGAHAALFEECEIRTVVDTTNATSGGYLVQARSQFGYPGFVFLNSTLTAEAGVPAGSSYLARSPGSTTNPCAATGNACDNVAYINTKMGSHIASVGWALQTPAVLPNPLVATDTSGWREYGSMNASGGVLDVSTRDSHSAQISSSGYTGGFSTRAKVFAQWNSNAGWIPVP